MGAAVAAVLVKERHVADAFISARATSADRAVGPDDIGVDLAGIGGRRLLRREVLREASPGRYYLDEPSWRAMRSTRRRLALTLVIIAAMAALYSVTVAGGHAGVLAK